MKIIDPSRNKPKSIRKAFDLPVGQVFYGTLGGVYEGLFLRAYCSIVFLEKPDTTWTFKESPNLEVKDYEPVEAEIHVKRS